MSDMYLYFRYENRVKSDTFCNSHFLGLFACVGGLFGESTFLSQEMKWGLSSPFLSGGDYRKRGKVGLFIHCSQRVYKKVPKVPKSGTFFIRLHNNFGLRAM